MGDVENPPKKGESQGSVSEQTYPSSSRTPSTDPRKTHKRSEASSERDSPYNSVFMENVLKPRYIGILANKFPDTAYAHFDIDVPETRHVASIDPTKKLPESSIWVDTSDAFVQRIKKRYTEMLFRNLCDAEYATYVKEKLLKRDEFADGEQTYAREWRAERFVELATEPGSRGPWVAPPIIEGSETAKFISAGEYPFDIRPDCAYWVSLQGTDKKLGYMIKAIVHTIYHNFTSPYFTIEFKKDDKKLEVALNRLVGASALALYNRFCLRQKRMLQENTWTTRRTRVLRHYGTTMEGEKYTVWCTRPTLTDDFTWAGCEMEMIGYGLCSSKYDIRELIRWIHEIHYWGLTKHAPRVEKDMKCIMEAHCKKEEGSPPSDAGDDSEDEPDAEDEMA